MKKLLYKVPLLLCCLIMLCSMSGCFIPKPEDYLPEFENEIYRYAVKTDSNGKQECYIVGLTEFGQSQTELILPEQIDGIPVRGIGYEKRSTPIWYYESIGDVSSDNLKRMFVPFNKNKGMWDKKCRINCPNGYIVSWKGLGVYGLDRIVGCNLLPEYFTNAYGTSYRDILANVSYMYNYEFAENDGYYWVDSYDNETISFIPPEPERENYTFAGWYKEPECINAWDFETDKTGEKLVVDNNTIAHYGNNYLPTLPSQYTEKDGLKLYAKWIKN